MKGEIHGNVSRRIPYYEQHRRKLIKLSSAVQFDSTLHFMESKNKVSMERNGKKKYILESERETEGVARQSERNVKIKGGRVGCKKGDGRMKKKERKEGMLILKPEIVHLIIFIIACKG
jgi:hypothetical protein